VSAFNCSGTTFSWTLSPLLCSLPTLPRGYHRLQLYTADANGQLVYIITLVFCFLGHHIRCIVYSDKSDNSDDPCVQHLQLGQLQEVRQ
jgi:hypothetical protein